MRQSVSRWGLAGSVVALALLALSGCAQPYAEALHGGLEQPPDFSIEFRVHGKNQAEDRLNQTSYYVLLPNRRLYIAVGADAVTERFPVSYIVLTLEQYSNIVEIVRTNSLHTEPNSPNLESVDETQAEIPVYRAAITAWGKTHRFRTIAEDSPPTVELLQALIEATTRGSGQSGDIAP